MEYREILKEQIETLKNWNNKNVEKEPEQVRKNIETICETIDFVT